MGEVYSTHDAAKVSGLSPARIRALARAGIVGHRRGPADRRLTFDFADLRILKTAGSLSRAGMPQARVERALTRLKDQLRDQSPLSAVTVFAEGPRLWATHAQRTWEPETGQQALPLRPTSAASSVVHHPAVQSREPLAEQGRSAEQWFEIAIELEEMDPQRAYEAYVNAMALNPEHVETLINIGRMCSTAGDSARASAYFRQAVRTNPEHPVAHYNLGVTAHDSGDLPTAQTCYERAVACDPNFADAHYNLATLLDQLGDTAGGAKHRAAYEAACTQRDPRPDP